MNIVLCNIDPSLNNIIISQLVHFKLNIILIDNDEDILEVLNKQQIDCLFYDIDIFEADVIRTLNDIQNQADLKNLKIVILTANKNKELLEKLFSMELTGVLSKNTDYHDFMDNLKRIIVFLEMEVKKRISRWIEPLKDDNVRVLFTLNNNQKIKMKVVEISVDGIKVKISSDKVLIALKSGSIGSDVILYINKKMFYVDMKIAGIRGSICKFLFTSQKDVFLLEISSYIYNLLLHQGPGNDYTG